MQVHNLNQAQRIVTSVASRADFGFTAGATSALLSCIVDTTQLASKTWQDDLQLRQEAVDALYRRLLLCSSQNSQDDPILQLHHQIFQIGAIVYFHRSVLNSPPHALVPFLDELLADVRAYRERGGGYVTLWPVFIAAVEAYEERHQEGFQDWLHDCDRMGAANRKDVREVIESVWRKRLVMWREMGTRMELGGIVVSWTEVMYESGLEVLLV